MNRFMTGMLFVSFFFWLPADVRAEEKAPSFRYSNPIETSAATEDEVFAVPLNSEIYAATRDGFPDLRVLDATGLAIPTLIRPATETRTTTVRKAWTAANPALKPIGKEGLEIRFTLLPEDPIPVGLRIVTPLQNFEQHVRILATADGVESTLVESVLIFDYSQFMDVRRTEIALPATTAREYRVLIDALTTDQESQLLELTRSMSGDSEENRSERTTIQRRPFRIDRIELWTEQAEQSHQSPATQLWPVTDVKVTKDVESKQTIVEFSSRREPLTSLKVQTSSRNFSRRAVVQVPKVSGKEITWHPIAEATISNISLRNLNEEHVQISLPETRQETYRIVIENNDNRELVIDGVEAAGHRHEVVFLKAPDTTCSLICGSATAETPQFDLASLQTALDRKLGPIAATLGPQTQLAVTETPEPVDAKSLINNPIVLGGIVGVLVIALGWGLFQASRRIDQMPSGEGNGE